MTKPVRFSYCIIAIFSTLILESCTWNGRGPSSVFTSEHRQFKNIIFMVPDGCSGSIQTLARWYKGEDLTLDAMNAGVVRTWMANSVITDSAAAGTAFACGHKTTDRFLGVSPRANDVLPTFTEYDPARAYAPMATILEMGRYRGKATGLVATSRITHATPAAFASHVPDRDWENEIMEHMVHGHMTVVMGGGRRHLLPEALGGVRTDGENLEQVLRDRGYTLVTTRDEMKSVSPVENTRVWGSFAMSHMDADIDRRHLNLNEPSLAEMTEKAIEVLRQDRDGFFLMVEGSQIDWAGHNNDPAWMVTDFLAFDDAVKVAVDFAKEDRQTLIICFPDHNTGGMNIGQYHAKTPYTATSASDLIGPLQKMAVTADMVVESMNGDFSEANIKAALQSLWGIEANNNDISMINELAPSKGMSYALARTISRNHTAIGWTSHGHNGEDTPVWVYPQTKTFGVIDNTEIPSVISQWTGKHRKMTLDQLTEELYISAEDLFPGEWELDRSDPENPVVVVRGEFSMPIGKDILIYDNQSWSLGSLVVYAPLRDGDDADGDIHTILEDRVYVPRKATGLIESIIR